MKIPIAIIESGTVASPRIFMNSMRNSGIEMLKSAITRPRKVETVGGFVKSSFTAAFAENLSDP